MCDLSVIVVNWNAGTELLRTLQTLYQALAVVPNSEVILVDNASTDGSTPAAAREFPQLQVVINPTNLGFGTANNIGFAQARGRYLLLVNPDLRVNAAALEVMLNFMQMHPKAGICGPKVTELDGVTLSSWCARRDPHPWDVFCEYAFLTRLFPSRYLFARYVMGDWDHSFNREVDALTGACLFVRREVVEQIGGFDEHFFMYGEDLDWCRRIRRASWQVWYVAGAAVHHVGAQSTRQVSDHGSWWSLVSYLNYFRKWGNLGEIFRARLALSSGNFIRAIAWFATSFIQPGHFRHTMHRSTQYFRYSVLAWVV